MHSFTFPIEQAMRPIFRTPPVFVCMREFSWPLQGGYLKVELRNFPPVDSRAAFRGSRALCIRWTVPVSSWILPGSEERCISRSRGYVRSSRYRWQWMDERNIYILIPNIIFKDKRQTGKPHWNCVSLKQAGYRDRTKTLFDKKQGPNGIEMRNPQMWIPQKFCLGISWTSPSAALIGYFHGPLPLSFKIQAGVIRV